MNNTTREFIAIIGFDEEKIADYSKNNCGGADIAPIDFLEMEFGWMEQSGVTLENCALIDFDVQWEQYLRYLVDWAITHSSDDEIGKSPMSYKAWAAKQTA